MMMKKTRLQRGWPLLAAAVLLSFGLQSLLAQGTSGELKWLRIGSLQTYFSEEGAEEESGGLDRISVKFIWPADYGFWQYTTRANGMWLGCKEFYDTKMKEKLPVKVVGIGPRNDVDSKNAVLTPPVEFKLIARNDHPIVVVDKKLASVINTQYDVIDGFDENLPADRMLVVKNNTALGVTVTKKVYAFTQQYHDNYFIYDYVLKNTGIVDAQGTVYPQTLKDFTFYLMYRWSLAGEAVLEYQVGWGVWNEAWGRNTVNDVVGTDPAAPDFRFRAAFAWYGLHSERPADDWGCPDERETGVMAAARYIGTVTLHADTSPKNQTDDATQPRTTYYEDTDGPTMQPTGYSQYDKLAMSQRYDVMTRGHATKTQAQEVGEGFADTWGAGIGGSQEGLGFGPYTLESGDSIHIVVAQGVAGLNWEKNREIGANWLQYYKGTGSPNLALPNGSTTTDHNKYKREWVWTCKDSLFQTFDHAIKNYNSNFVIPQPPPPPNSFTVSSGGDKILLEWADNADSWPYFDGYVIYRSEGNVMDLKTVYKKIFECNKSNTAHSFNDITASRGFDYYYYIQTKDDGSTNDIQPGRPLFSSKFLTVTNEKARLLRPAANFLDEVRVVPNPYDIRARAWQFGDQSQYDRIAFYGLPPQCKLKIFTENGVLIWEKNHTNGAGDEIWDSMTSSGQIVVSGVYILYVEVTEDAFAKEDKIAPWDIYDDNKKLMFSKDELMFHQGDQIFRKGESKYRKFVVIR